jgi:hypothetical protein
MAFFFPEAYSSIDWGRGFEFLDGELQQVARKSETDKITRHLNRRFCKVSEETVVKIGSYRLIR